MKRLQASLITVSTLITLCSGLALQDVRSNPNASNRNTTQSISNSIDCNISLETNVEICAKTIMDMILGTMKVWPQNVDQMQDYCDTFIVTEKCIKEVGRKCSKGLHRTIVSTVGSAVQRVRKRECGKEKLTGLLKVTKCVQLNKRTVAALVGNITTELNLIDTQVVEVDKRTNAICCNAISVEDQIKSMYANLCPNENNLVGNSVASMYKNLISDIVDLICLKKQNCNDYLKGYKSPKSKATDGVIAMMLKIVFSLGE